jgi:hypothetical protein
VFTALASYDLGAGFELGKMQPLAVLAALGGSVCA